MRFKVLVCRCVQYVMYERYLGCQNLQYFAAFCRLSSFCCRFFLKLSKTPLFTQLFYSLPHKTTVFSDCFPDKKRCPSSVAYHHPHQLPESTPYSRHSSQDVQRTRLQVPGKPQIKLFWHQMCGQNLGGGHNSCNMP